MRGNSRTYKCHSSVGHTKLIHEIRVYILANFKTDVVMITTDIPSKTNIQYLWSNSPAKQCTFYGLSFYLGTEQNKKHIKYGYENDVLSRRICHVTGEMKCTSKKRCIFKFCRYRWRTIWWDTDCKWHCGERKTKWQPILFIVITINSCMNWICEGGAKEILLNSRRSDEMGFEENVLWHFSNSYLKHVVTSH